jgi:hypothetical protein
MPRHSLVAITVVAVLVAVAAVTNPSAERHRERIKTAIAERSPLAGVLGIGALTAFTSTYHPLGVASYATVNGRTVSVGAFGMVFVLQPSPER